jgi:hypothetical protein
MFCSLLAQSALQPDMPARDTLHTGSCAVQKVKGAYSCICLVNDVGVVAFRDPNGIRPLVLGRRESPDGTEWCVASEDCAFGPIGFEMVRDVQPGEMCIITKAGELIASQCTTQQLAPCIFEYIYLARPDSVLNGISVYALAAAVMYQSFTCSACRTACFAGSIVCRLIFGFWGESIDPLLPARKVRVQGFVACWLNLAREALASSLALRALGSEWC